MAQLAHRERRVLERVGVTVDEEHDFLARRIGEAPCDLGLQHGGRLLMRVDRSGGPDEARRGGLDAVGDRRKAPELRCRSELQVEWHRAPTERVKKTNVPVDLFC
jgi:hypothetical protein